MSDLVITGAGAVGPLGQGRARLAERLAHGPPEAAGRVGALDGFDPIESRRLDRIARLAVLAAREAVAEAGLDPAGQPEGAGMILGTLSGGQCSARKFLDRALAAGGPPASPAVYTNAVRNAPAAHVTLELGLHGPSCTVCLGEVSALAAVVQAAEILEEERAAALLAGGVEELDEELGALHRRHGRDWGTEGAYLVLLEAAAAARSRGAEVLASVRGRAQVSVPVVPGTRTDDPEPLARAVRLALEDAGCAPSEIGLVIHTTGASPDPARWFDGCAAPVLDLPALIGRSSCVGAAGILVALHALGGGDLPAAAAGAAPAARPDPVLVIGAGAGGHHVALLLSRHCLFS